MNDILKELLEEFPELKEDSEKLEKVVDYLQKSKPSVEASMEFKDSLRNRLDNIISIRQGKKNNLGKILIPVFSFCLIVALVFVYYNDFSSVENKGQNFEELNQSFKMSSEGIDDSLFDTGGGKEMIISDDQSRVGTEKDNTGTLQVVDYSTGDGVSVSSMSMDSIEESTLQEIETIIQESEDMLKTQPSILENGDTIHSLKNMEEELPNSPEVVNVKEEIDDVMSLLDDLFKGIDVQGEAVSFDSNNEEEDSPSFNLYTFEEYCKNNKGIAVETAHGMTCRKSGTECREESFNGVSCEFVPLN